MANAVNKELAGGVTKELEGPLPLEKKKQPLEGIRKSCRVMEERSIEALLHK